MAWAPNARCALVYGSGYPAHEWCPPAAPAKLGVELRSKAAYASDDTLLDGGCLPDEDIDPFRLFDLREARAGSKARAERVLLRKPRGTMRPGEPDRLATQADFAHWNEGDDSVATTVLCPVQVTWAPKWFAEIGAESEIILRREPRSPVELELRAISFADAAIAVTPDGHYDLLGSEPAKALPFLTCEVEGKPAPIESCEHMRVPGLLARTWERLEASP